MAQLPTNNPELLELYQGLQCGKLVLKLAANDEERNEVFRLRFKVFNEELGEGLAESRKTGLDKDAFDEFCDHLMVISNGVCVGTYRLLFGPKKPASGFYTDTEFDITPLKLHTPEVVEIGRGCIQSEFRKQTTLMGLFWGVHRYMMARKARYLMGCASLVPMSHDGAEATFEKLRAMKSVDLSTGVVPKAGFECAGDASKGQAEIPPLIGFYLQFGARILGRPAFDPVFGCHDFFIIFDMDHLSEWGSELLNRFDKRLGSGTNGSENGSSDEE